ncbi:hypothetical protein BGX33_000851, partial [Mortierella sp. NVP41]
PATTTATAIAATAASTDSKHKRRRSSVHSVQSQHQRRRSSSAWAYGEDARPWSPWSRWRLVLKLLYAVVVPAVIIYLLKNMDQRVPSQHKQQPQQQQRNQHYRNARGGSLWRDTVSSPSPTLGAGHVESNKGSWWRHPAAAAGAGPDFGEHRCTGSGSGGDRGEPVDEPRKSQWFPDGDGHQC